MKALRKKLDVLDEDPYYADITLLANAPSTVDEHGKIQRIATLPPHPTDEEINAMEKNGVDWRSDQEATVPFAGRSLTFKVDKFSPAAGKYPKIVENFTSDFETRRKSRLCWQHTRNLSRHQS